MTGERRVYAIALVVAVLALVVSLGAALTFMAAGGGRHLGDATPVTGPDGVRPGVPGGPMMGQGRSGGGMMGDWDGPDDPSISADAAKAAADAWAAVNQPGATVGTGVRMPMGYVFTVIRDGQGMGTIVVSDETGQVAWWGAAQASPTPSDS